MKGTSFLSKLSTLFLFLGLFAALPVFSQDGEKITGKVVDGSGEPLIGVSVIIQGTTSGGV
jgi:Zn-dependent protease